MVIVFRLGITLGAMVQYLANENKILILIMEYLNQWIYEEMVGILYDARTYIWWTITLWYK